MKLSDFREFKSRVSEISVFRSTEFVKKNKDCQVIDLKYIPGNHQSHEINVYPVNFTELFQDKLMYNFDPAATRDWCGESEM